MSVEVRPVRWGDFESWADLDLARYEELAVDPDLGLYTRDPKPTRAEVAEYFGGVLAGVTEGTMVFEVAVDGDRVVGHCGVFPKGEYAEIRHIGSLGMVVLPRWRRQGLGGRLLARALADCRGRFETVELAVVESNGVARRLYRRHGFEERGRLPRAFKRGDRYLDEIVMTRSIEAPTATDAATGPSGPSLDTVK